jgi:hypothetical protein
VINVGAKPPPPCGGWGAVEGYGLVAMHEMVPKNKTIHPADHAKAEK